MHAHLPAQSTKRRVMCGRSPDLWIVTIRRLPAPFPGTVTGHGPAGRLPTHSGGPVPESHRLSYSSRCNLHLMVKDIIETPHAILFPLATLGYGRLKVNGHDWFNASGIVADPASRTGAVRVISSSHKMVGNLSINRATGVWVSPCAHANTRQTPSDYVKPRSSVSRHEVVL